MRERDLPIPFNTWNHNVKCSFYVFIQLYEIEYFFSKYGTVVDVFNPGKGFAFVTFEEALSAEKAINKLNGKEKFGSVLSMNVSKPKEKASKGKKKKKKKGALDLSENSRIFVKNIDKDADLEEVKKKFGEFGDVKDVYNPGKGFIFIR